VPRRHAHFLCRLSPALSLSLPPSLFHSFSVRLCAGPLRRLGHIYKAQENPHRALECFQAICDAPPPPLTQADVWFLIGSVQETMEPPAPEFARQAYVHVLSWAGCATSLRSTNHPF
jgi:hypothetical protein